MHLAIATVATTHPTVHAQKRPGPNRQSAHCAGAKRPCEEGSGVGEKESGCTSDTGHRTPENWNKTIPLEVEVDNFLILFVSVEMALF